MAKRHRDETTTDTPNKRIRCEFSSVITVLVGQDEELFAAHTDLICQRSSYFEAACSKEWMASQDQPSRLPDHAAESFRLYLHTLYTGLEMALVEKETEVSAHCKSATRLKSKVQLVLSELWILTDYLDDDLAREITMAALVDHENSSLCAPSTFTIKHLWPLTVVASGWRRYAVDTWMQILTKEVVDNHISLLPQEFMLGLLKKSVGSQKPSPRVLDRADYT